MRFALFVAIPLALLAGCTDDEKAPDVTPSTAASAVPPSPPGDLPEAEAPRGALSAVGTEADWDTFVLACKNPEQEPVVQQVVTGDVTGDGVADAVVVRTCDSATTYIPSTIEVFDGSSPAQRPWRVGKPLLAGDADHLKPWVTQAEVRSGEIAVKFNGYQPSYESDGSLKPNQAKCPEYKFEYRFRLEGTDFLTTHKAAGIEGSGTGCLPAGL
ncbi:hypothetical protein Ait01nite_087530 [Actinoplanes italicus]|uniref:LppP/LprE lipoprotein n=1 Tax=Actinoplanes italicus TaxID=113567 RepID=A0A2T0K486_9ACTN|nr:hypothetical protein [Actinoplanes italicus]PRX17702.1 hypothetical protein CLV67_115205 [Actinoplanes italicus]GIE35708.1 hypothetical protein Ait01nite_087530 [Actinoplanes italicus]